MSKTRILLVEDDEDDYILALDYLEEINFLDIELIRAKNAAEAFELMANQKFDLCLLDYQLGSINGLEVLEKSQELGFSAPIIMLTGHRDDVLDQSALDAGAVDYLIKSEIDSIRFARAIRYALARRDVEIERVERLKAEAENQSKNRFLAHLSHELRTPLTAILGYTELLLNTQLGKTSHSELDVILRNSRHLLNLLNDILDLSKIAANKLELNNSKINLDGLVTDIYSLLRVSAIDKGLELIVESTTEMPVEIFCDATRLRQVLINLINNAIKFTHEGYVKLSIRTAVIEGREIVCFDVEDTGVGIAQDKIVSIFQPFSQIADVVSKSLGGSGLGLAISTELATRMGGGIDVTSKLGVGSKFTAFIDPGDLSGIPRSMMRFNTDLSFKPRLNRDLLQGRILVVDDLRDIRRLVGHIVEGFGLQVEYASNGLVAVNAVSRSAERGTPFDLVLMDVHMPEMDGKTAATEMRQRELALPIVALTAASMRGSLEKLKTAGFDNLLSKPVDTEKLYKMLSKYLPYGEPHSEVLVESHVVAMNVLIVEDDVDAASALEALLQLFDVRSEIAHSIEEATLKIYESSWSAVLLDKNLPDGSGLTLIAEIDSFSAHNGTHRPYIALITGESLESEVVEALGIDSMLLKPIQMKSLKSFVLNLKSRSIDR